ncbi:Lcl C-terminal domain-containing protein [Candidatus Thiodiazotropha sp. CDECU1]|uniref:Lcl C-terminal domain-containing protein n=1 Tax=Candidatus Thiodiazotropha sp. CDECU1 TaxID=3065865 RepID=UPI00292EFB69|nr:DUF1566 domain-containing protein [Candidatus Thiodiazotropha sp. CDECU1]
MKAVWVGIVTSSLFYFPATQAQFEPDNRRPPGGGPPTEAFEVCEQKRQGSDCSFQAPHGKVEGNCRNMREGMVCVPNDHRRRISPDGRLPPGRIGPRDSEYREPGAPAVIQVKPSDNAFGPSARDVVTAHNRVPDSGQIDCYTNRQRVACANIQQRFKGQDGHYGARQAYRHNGDGTVTDLVTGLLWQQAHNQQRLAYRDAAEACSRLDLAGIETWRLPTITELFSISHWQHAGSQQWYLDRRYFELQEPGPEILAGDPYRATHNTSMMGQTWSSTNYAGHIELGAETPHAFFFNFLDGRIKAASKRGRSRLFYRCVSGESWGDNLFLENHNGTVSDAAMNLQWQQADDGQPRDWPQALAYCEGLNLAGYSDWRLPNIKELQTLVDYRYSDPAIDPNFFKQQDKRGWFWSSTTHGESPSMASYICFGPCTSVDGKDVHGAGAQRSDPKTGNPSRWRARGGQRDETRIFNYARCVRDTKD